MCVFVDKKMKVIASYLLAVLGGNTSPSAADLKKILASGIVFFFLISLYIHFFLYVSFCVVV